MSKLSSRLLLASSALVLTFSLSSSLRASDLLEEGESGTTTAVSTQAPSKSSGWFSSWFSSGASTEQETKEPPATGAVVQQTDGDDDAEESDSEGETGSGAEGLVDEEEMAETAGAVDEDVTPKIEDSEASSGQQSSGSWWPFSWGASSSNDGDEKPAATAVNASDTGDVKDDEAVEEHGDDMKAADVLEDEDTPATDPYAGLTERQRQLLEMYDNGEGDISQSVMITAQNARENKIDFEHSFDSATLLGTKSLKNGEVSVYAGGKYTVLHKGKLKEYSGGELYERGKAFSNAAQLVKIMDGTAVLYGH